MGSKYDRYWSDQLPLIHAQLQIAAAGTSAVVSLPDLTHLGARQSWYGVAEVHAEEMTRSSMAHATSLGRTVAASGICRQWPERVFRFTINANGDALAITAPAGRPSDLPTGPGRRPQDRWQPVPQNGSARNDRAPGLGEGSRQSDIDEFYRILDQLTAGLGGPQHLRDCTGSSGCPPQGIYFFYEDGENRIDGSRRVIRVGTHALTATSKATLWDRLRQHRGQLAGRNPDGGNHRASVFRLHVGTALIRRDGLPDELLRSWLDRHRAPAQHAAGSRHRT